MTTANVVDDAVVIPQELCEHVEKTARYVVSSAARHLSDVDSYDEGYEDRLAELNDRLGWLQAIGAGRPIPVERAVSLAADAASDLRDMTADRLHHSESTIPEIRTAIDAIEALEAFVAQFCSTDNDGVA